MSHENVQLVTRCFELFNRGEMEAMLQLVDPAIETIEGVELPGAARYVGHAGLAMAYEHWAGQWDDFRNVWTVENCKLVRFRIFNAKAQALEAAGLRE
jgi:hypothetical protein